MEIKNCKSCNKEPEQWVIYSHTEKQNVWWWECNHCDIFSEDSSTEEHSIELWNSLQEVVE